MAMTRWVAFLVPCAMAACASTKVETIYGPSAVERVAGYRTYSWFRHPAGTNSEVYSSIMEANIERTTDSELARQGFRRVAETEPSDFRIAWHAALKKQVEISSINGYYGYYWDPFFGPTTYVKVFDQGTFILDVVDTASNRLIWRGWARSNLSANPGPEELQEKIDNSIQKILESFPPKPKK